MTRPILEPGLLHPITVDPTPHRVTVSAGGRTIVDTTRALTLTRLRPLPAEYTNPTLTVNLEFNFTQ